MEKKKYPKDKYFSSKNVFRRVPIFFVTVK